MDIGTLPEVWLQLTLTARETLDILLQTTAEPRNHEAFLRKPRWTWAIIFEALSAGLIPDQLLHRK